MFVPSGRSALGMIGDRHDLERSQRLAGRSGGDARKALDHLKLLLGQQAGEFGVAAFAHHEHMQRIARRGEGRFQARDQPEYREQHRNGYGDARRGHDGGRFTNNQIAKVVGERNRHSVLIRCNAGNPGCSSAPHSRPARRS